MDLRNLKREVEQRAELEVSMEDIRRQLPIQKQTCRQLQAHLDCALADVAALEKSSVKGIVLNILGKREDVLEQARRTVRKAESELAAAERQYAFMQRQLREFWNEWKKAEDLETAYYSELESCLQKQGTAVPFAFIENWKKAQQLNRAMELLEQMKAARKGLEPLLTKVEDAYWYGNVRTDLSGNRYNNRMPALKSALEPFLVEFSDLIHLITEFNAHIPTDLAVDLSASWITKQDYWANPQLPEELYQRVEPVRAWLQNLQHHWGNLEKDLHRRWKNQQTTLREQAWSIHACLQEP